MKKRNNNNRAQATNIHHNELNKCEWICDGDVDDNVQCFGVLRQIAYVRLCACCFVNDRFIKNKDNRPEKEIEKLFAVAYSVVFICCLLLESTHWIARVPRFLTH